MDHKFQINLRGIIDLLSNHLYSGPEVYLRELLQNGVDAIRARRVHQPEHRAEIRMEIVPGRGGKRPTLIFSDNGIGLDESEVHQFLATIGQSSKGADLWERPQDFIGQFGIGLLACFVVSDEIVVITRSIKEGSPAMEWRGRPDGTYSLKQLDHDFEPGTKVYLNCKPDCEEYFEPNEVVHLATHFGQMLPFPIYVETENDTVHINEDGPPWKRAYASREEQREALLDFGRRTFESDFFDCIPLRSEVGQVEGVAYVLPYSPSLASKQSHRVYLKGMLLSEQAENLLPEWAFFVKCIVNANDLRPMASREAFYEDDNLAATRAALGDCLRQYLIDLSERSPQQLQRLIGLHGLSIKALAVNDDEFFRMFIDWLPFETTLGDMTLAEYRKEHRTLRYVRTVDQFRQIARVASAQGMGIINGGYVYHQDLLEKYGELYPGTKVEAIDATSLSQAFEDLSLDEREEVHRLVKAADLVLQPFRCAADVRKFAPEELPALYSTGADAEFLRSMEQSKDVADSLWSSVLDNLGGSAAHEMYSRLCLNYRNPLIRKLAKLKDRTLLQRSLEMLYVQSLLLGHHPLSSREMALLNDGLIGLLEWGIEKQAGGEA